MLSRHSHLAGTALAMLVVVPATAFVAFEILKTQPPAMQTAPVAGRQPGAAPEAQETSATDNRGIAQVAPEPVLQQAPLPDSLPESAQGQTMEMQVAMPPPMADTAQSLPSLVARKALPAHPARAPLPLELQAAPAEDRERFANADSNPVKSVASDPVSTFSIDVDTASYSFVRRSLLGGQMPVPDSVRVEELINYFPYDWPAPESADEPFRATVSLMPTPWNAGTRLMQVAIKGHEIAQDSAPPANLVLLIDVSGSMDAPDKLPLLKNAFRLMLARLKPEDRVAIVTYAGHSGTVLEPTPARERDRILAALDGLQPGGSTAGAEGIEAAYRLARQAFIEGGVNRVMLATDGDFNVGTASEEELKRLIEDRRRDGIFLSVLGFGRGNLNDSLMQALAQNGNGNAAYIDTLAEAQKVLVEAAGSTLFPIASDVKIQVEFNPRRIAEYRLIGYETRALRREDFNNDRVDAGDIGSGHSVTAIYEVTPQGSPAVLNDPLRYGEAPAAAPGTGETDDELAFVKIRYKQPGAEASRLITTPVTEGNALPDIAAASGDLRFATAVAAFGQKLRRDPALAGYSWDAILGLAREARGADPFGYRGGFLDLIRLAETLDRN